jgi:membrane protease subunit HflC
MSSTLKYIVGGIIAILLIVAFSATFVVQQTNQALVFQFGRIARAPITEPGLYFKWPLIQNVVYIDKRILDLELPTQEVIASDQKRLVVDAFTRYRVTDPLLFYQSVGSVAGASARLTSIVNSTVRTVLADASFSSVVRTSRNQLMQKIRDDVNRQAGGLGIEVVDVRLRRADLPEQNSQAVFQRMQTERQREAADIRAQGSQESQRIRAEADRDVVVIRANATRESEILRGRGDAERNRILSQAFGRDPEFFAFWRSMQAYEEALKAGGTQIVMSPNSEFFRFFSTANPAGKPGDRLPSAPGTTPPAAPGAAPAPGPSGAAAPAAPAPSATP